MSRRSKRRTRHAVFILLPVVMAILAALAPAFLGSGDRADAATAAEWARVKGYLDSFISSQYVPDTVDGESGFLVDAPALRGRIDSNANMSITTGAGVLGEGDDAANAPVLLDVLSGNPTFIPGTAVRCNWNTTCLQPATVAALANEIDQHQAAGFSTDVVVYCATGHTESPVAGGLGALAQTGGLGGSAAPRVMDLKWGRYGWNTGSRAYGSINPLGTPGTPGPPYDPPAQPQCNGAISDAELVRCLAEWALSATGGNVGNGISPPVTSYQVIDLRTGSYPTTILQGNPTLQIPLNTIFSSGLSYLNPAGPKKLFVNRTQHTAGMVAEGAEMLGYDATFMQWGMANYNDTLEEEYTGGAGYPLVNNTVNPIDIIAPTVSSVAVSNITETSATITRVANEPATLRIEYGTSPGIYSDEANNTVLNGTKSVVLNDLSPLTTYYARVTSYDGQANGTVSTEIQFMTPDQLICAKAELTLELGPNSGDTLVGPYWASYQDYNSRQLSVSLKVNNTGATAAHAVNITGASPVQGWPSLLSSMPMYLGEVPAGAAAAFVVKYYVPAGGPHGFDIRVTGSAGDDCGLTYMYP